MPDEPEPTSGGLEVAIDIPCGAWTGALPDAESICQRAARAAWQRTPDRATPSELSIVLADDALVQGLNKQFRHQDKPTNVLSFPLGDDGVAPDGGRLLGDVILAFETSAREAADQGKPLAAHTAHLIVHGVLHVMGFDHDADAEAEAMESLEREILATLDIADPYLSEQALP